MAIARGNREQQHLGNRPRINAKASSRFPIAQTFPLNRKANASIQIHALHPPALCPVGQRTIHCRILTPAQPDSPVASLRDFLSGAYSKAERSDVLGFVESLKDKIVER